MNYPGWDMNGFWIMSIVSGVVGLAITIGLVVLIVLAIRWLLRQERSGRQGPGGMPPDDPMDVLRRRYAAGEIDEEEFERRRKVLGV